MGFLAPPASVFFVARRTTISRIPDLILLPGLASQYCFMQMLENPFTPPK
jgi:hypothetical protein